MGEFIELMIRPFVVCVILTGIHAYLGLHVVQRGVIFVDLALAQVAALGATTAFLFGYSLHSTESYFIALALTVAAAGLLALVRFERSPVPQEAFIGVVYAVSAAAAVLILSRAPQGGEELKSILVGHLLFVDWPEVIKILVIYSVVGAIHWWARGPLNSISASPERAREQGLSLRAWDFLFYGTFAVVVTSSVELGGVLLVFSYLVVPALCAALVASSIASRLLIGWLIGLAVSLVGAAGSYWLDLPTGAAIVCVFGLVALGFILTTGARQSRA